MKIPFDTKKGSEAFSNILKKATDVSKKAVEGVKNTANDLSEKNKIESYQKRLKKYNPLFPDVYMSEDFKMPSVIVITDDLERRDIDVCEGAIGWIEQEHGVEVLCLYRDAIEMRNISFIPFPSDKTAYYVDNFDSNRYIKADSIFDRAHDERIAELKQIAHMLGAKSCSIEISESDLNLSQTSKKMEVKESVKKGGPSGAESVSISNTVGNTTARSGKIEAYFTGNSIPKKPVLKWFKHDETIKKLIEMRFDSENSLTTEFLYLSGSSSATMSQSMAIGIDCALSKIMNVKSSLNMESRASKEHCSKLTYIVEF